MLCLLTCTLPEIIPIITKRRTFKIYRMSFQTAKFALGMPLLIFPFLAFAQINERDKSLEVLKYNHIGKEYIFKAEDQSTTYLKYLGWLSTKKGMRYKFINSIWIWGQSHRATNRILIYNDRDKYIGNYPITTIDNLPSFIKDNKLVFKNKRNNSGCNLQSITYINFDNGIPHEFFRKFNGDKGDIYTFDKE